MAPSDKHEFLSQIIDCQPNNAFGYKAEYQSPAKNSLAHIIVSVFHTWQANLF